LVCVPLNNFGIKATQHSHKLIKLSANQKKHSILQFLKTKTFIIMILVLVFAFLLLGSNAGKKRFFHANPITLSKRFVFVCLSQPLDAVMENFPPIHPTVTNI
jgi:uncharacterized membrane protein